MRKDVKSMSETTQAALGERASRPHRAIVEGQELVLIGVIVALWVTLGFVAPTILEPSLSLIHI